MTTYRLPDWLGGHEVFSPSEIGTDGCRRVDIVLPEGSPGTLRVPAEYLVEVKPPSIDDPVELPLDFRDGEGVGIWIGATPMSDRAGRISCNSSADLTAEQCRDAARVLWLLGTREASS